MGFCLDKTSNCLPDFEYCESCGLGLSGGLGIGLDFEGIFLGGVCSL